MCVNNICWSGKLKLHKQHQNQHYSTDTIKLNNDLSEYVYWIVSIGITRKVKFIRPIKYRQKFIASI